MRKNINEIKKVESMLRPEVVRFVYQNQDVLFNQESTKKDINNMNDNRLYEIAYEIENKMN